MKQLQGFVGIIRARKLAKNYIPREDVPMGHVKEEGERVRLEFVIFGVHQNQLGS